MSFVVRSGGDTRCFNTLREAAQEVDRDPSISNIAYFSRNEKYRLHIITKSEKIDPKFEAKFCSLSDEYKAETKAVRYWALEIMTDFKCRRYTREAEQKHIINNIKYVYTEAEFRKCVFGEKDDQAPV